VVPIQKAGADILLPFPELPFARVYLVLATWWVYFFISLNPLMMALLQEGSRRTQCTFVMGHTGTASAVYVADCLKDVLLPFLSRQSQDHDIPSLKPGNRLLAGLKGLTTGQRPALWRTEALNVSLPWDILAQLQLFPNMWPAASRMSCFPSCPDAQLSSLVQYSYNSMTYSWTFWCG